METKLQRNNLEPGKMTLKYTALNFFHVCINIFCIIVLRAELQIRGGIKDNSKIIFLISQQKHML